MLPFFSNQAGTMEQEQFEVRNFQLLWWLANPNLFLEMRSVFICRWGGLRLCIEIQRWRCIEPSSQIQISGSLRVGWYFLVLFCEEMLQIPQRWGFLLLLIGCWCNIYYVPFGFWKVKITHSVPQSFSKAAFKQVVDVPIQMLTTADLPFSSQDCVW